MINKTDIDAFKQMQEPIDQVGLYKMDPDWSPPARQSTPLEMVTDFAKCMDQPLKERWLFSHNLERLRWKMISEEYGEAFDESDSGNSASNMLKELADLVYVTYGYAATYGWDLDKAVRRVHQSNMSKLGVDGKPLKDPTGKVMKGPNYRKPDLTDLVETN